MSKIQQRIRIEGKYLDLLTKIKEKMTLKIAVKLLNILLMNI